MVEVIDERFTYKDHAISEGGQARVYRGYDLKDEVPVAIKIFDLDPELLDDFVLAWQTELAAYRGLPKHDHLANVVAHGRLESGVPYIVLEWLDTDLLQALNDRQIEGWDDFWPVARDILSGLAVIHRHEMIHRDLKPRNVLVSQDGRFRIADFGTARLRPTTDFVNTFAFHGSIPYSPPEFGTLSPTAAYDVYSFAVLVTGCLAGRDLTTQSEVMIAFDELDLPVVVEDVLRACLANDPAQRPASATILLRSLSKAQMQRESASEKTHEVTIDLPPGALRHYANLVGRDDVTVDDLIEDLGQSPRLAMDKEAGSAGAIKIAGQTILVQARVDDRAPWLLRVHRITLPFRRHLDDARQTWWAPRIGFRSAAPLDFPTASSNLAKLIEGLQAYESDLAAAHVGGERTLFRKFEQVLQAKEQLTRYPERAIRFTGARREGRRLYLRTDQSVDLSPNEPRLVQNRLRERLFVEYEGQANDEIVLYVTRGEMRELPSAGVLEVDSELSKSKLRRERNALEAVRDGTSLRDDLRDLLIAPRHSRVAAGDVDEIDFVNAELDDDKKEAVAKTIHAKDMLVVEGPPGTGKTTFIAEAIAQELAHHESPKILLAAQTHIALDNALSRIQQQLPDAKFLRIGSAAKLESFAEPWSIPAQMALWRDECLANGSSYVTEFAAALGIDSGDETAEALASRLERGIQQATEYETALGAERELRVQVKERLDLRASQIRRVMEQLIAIEAAADGGDAGLDREIDRLIDEGTKVVETLEASGSTPAELFAIDARIEQLQKSLDDALDANRVTVDALREETGLSSTTAEGELIEHVLAQNRKARHQVTILQELVEDWAARLEADTSLHAVLLARADIVATTCVALTGVRGAKEVPFDLCLIDEASKASPTELLVPLASSRRWVLVGDDRQLPPYLEREFEDPAFLAKFEITQEDAREGLFSRLAAELPPENRITLRHQHRMHPIIGDLVSSVFYQGVLQSTARAVDPLVGSCFGSPVAWLDTSSSPQRTERVRGTTIENKFEARTIRDQILKLEKLAVMSGQEQRRIAVLSGYEGQTRVLSDVLAPHRSGITKFDIEIATVDSFQGQEADICFFSMTRSNPAGDIGFLRQRERLNVAMSRARDGLIIVGDSGMASKFPAGRTSALGEVWRSVSTKPEYAVIGGLT